MPNKASSFASTTFELSAVLVNNCTKSFLNVIPSLFWIFALLIIRHLFFYKSSLSAVHREITFFEISYCCCFFPPLDLAEMFGCSIEIPPWLGWDSQSIGIEECAWREKFIDPKSKYLPLRYAEKTGEKCDLAIDLPLLVVIDFFTQYSPSSNWDGKETRCCCDIGWRWSENLSIKILSIRYCEFRSCCMIIVIRLAFFAD